MGSRTENATEKMPKKVAGFLTQRPMLVNKKMNPDKKLMRILCHRPVGVSTFDAASAHIKPMIRYRLGII
jgi:hypothetical protein